MTSYQERKKRKRERTIQNSQVRFRVTGLPWRAGEVSVVEAPLTSGNVLGFAHGDWLAGVELISQDRLPREFFLHQLLDVEPSDHDSLLEFVATWGFPYHPLRMDDYLLSEFEVIADTLQIREKRDDTVREARKGVRLTENLREHFQPKGLDAVISEAEARLTIELLQSVSMEIQAAIRDHEPLSQTTIRVLNTATCSEKVIVPASGSLSLDTQKLGLTNGIVNQIIDTVSDPADWYFCDSSNCNHLFKRKQGSSKRPASDSIYCSDTCKNYAVTNERRKHIKHGR